VKTRKSKTIANERIKSCLVFVCCITLNEYQNNSWLKQQTSNYIYNASVLKYFFLVFNVMFKTQWSTNTTLCLQNYHTNEYEYLI